MTRFILAALVLVAAAEARADVAPQPKSSCSLSGVQTNEGQTCLECVVGAQDYAKCIEGMNHICTEVVDAGPSIEVWCTPTTGCSTVRSTDWSLSLALLALAAGVIGWQLKRRRA